MFRIEIKQAIPRFPEFQFTGPVSWTINEGENWALIGPNGAGKTLLTDVMQGRIVLKSGSADVLTNDGREGFQLVRSMAFRDIYSLADCRNMYYQQRWNSTDAEEAPVARSLLKEFSDEKIADYTILFGVTDLLDKRIISLSSGELRKFLITRVLMTEPKLLILDNPYIGLDASSRASLDAMLGEMARLNGLQTVMVLTSPQDIPEWIDRVMPMTERTCLPQMSRKEFLADDALLGRLFPELFRGIADLPGEESGEADYEEAIRMEAVKVRYGDRTILENIDWCVKKGEKWALLGRNGSGKSTLLSLVCGDNPQAYANRLTLFGRRRGTGESIWDIKKRIGYLSPDVHTYYLQDIPCLDVVASGFFDSVGLYRKCTEEQRHLAGEWLSAFGAQHLSGRSFVKISYGEQRLVLLARAFVRNPELLILDEPLHGLDAGRKKMVKEMIETFCCRKGKTLIYVTHYPHEIPDCVDHHKNL